ncbi:carboxypeptidase-like regulatory domain-containing protein [Psychroflexus salis]|uniref:CarboxypepD_reg-like domain-containing protein n=1 Tax=Psychroflexus salis TaxID=1526574 RepID=A0A917A0C0_9FLAO|nr:carboxypeptidase-like regulatory domain-containing protein [Psychroflexus salis]GGE20977.1 hypothetical protein GCM10010831_22550 [Psychroflexus salis]
MKNTFAFVCLCLAIFSSYAQTITGKIIDSELNEPVPFVNIQLSENKGTISNNEGIFRLNTEGFKSSHIVTFSSMGFEEFKVSLEELQQTNTIVLKPSDELLDQVIVSNKQLTALEIIQKFKENRDQNHQLGSKRYRLFYRSRNSYKPQQMVFQLKKASNLRKKERKRINKAMADLNKDVAGSTSLGFSESLRDLYVQDTVYTVDLKKKIYLADSDTKADIEEYQEEAIKKLFENFDSENTFKIKIGILKIADSVEVNSSDEQIRIQSSDVDEEDEDFSIDEYPRLAFENGNWLPDVITETKYYDYQLQEPTMVKGRSQYVIHFEPGRRKGKYEGKIYIDKEDFAITQIDYQLAEGKSLFSLNLKLLGIKFDQYKAQRSLRFTKTDEGFYVPYYTSSSSAQYVFLRRTLTFIENHLDRSKRIKFKLRFIIEAENETIDEWVLLEQENIEGKELPKDQFVSSLETETIETYSPDIWKDYPVFEATQEMKEYHFKD